MFTYVGPCHSLTLAMWPNDIHLPSLCLWRSYLVKLNALLEKQWGSHRETKHSSSIFMRRVFKCFTEQVCWESAWGSKRDHGQQSGKTRCVLRYFWTRDVRGDTLKILIKVRQRSVGVRCDYTVPLIISLIPRLLRVTLHERLRSGFCPQYRNSCTKPQHFPRCGNNSPTKFCIGLFLHFLLTKTWKAASRRHLVEI